MSRNTEATDDVSIWAGGYLDYKGGFLTRLQTDEPARGIDEDIVYTISARRNEPDWVLGFHLNALKA